MLRLVTNADNEITASLAKTAPVSELFLFTRKNAEGSTLCAKDGAIWFKDEKVVDTADILLPGVHNVENYMTAIGVVWGDVSLESIRYIAKHFGKIPHRIELTREINGVK